MKKRIQQRNLNERAADLAREDDLQTLFKPMIQSTETSTASLQNELKDLNSNLKKTSEDRKVVVNHPSLEDIMTSIGMADTSKLDPYFSIQRVKDGH